jgi:hypothetical protein
MKTTPSPITDFVVSELKFTVETFFAPITAVVREITARISAPIDTPVVDAPPHPTSTRQNSRR